MVAIFLQHSWLHLCCGMVLISLSGCREKQVLPDSDEVLPPVEVLQSDFRQAEIVVLIHLVAIRDVKWYADQWGQVGYIKYHMRGNVKRMFKGLGTSKTTIDYRCTLEADFRD